MGRGFNLLILTSILAMLTVLNFIIPDPLPLIDELILTVITTISTIATGIEFVRK